MKRILVFICIAFSLFFCSCENRSPFPVNNTNSPQSKNNHTSSINITEVGVSICGESINIQKDAGGSGFTLYLPAFSGDAVWILPHKTLIMGKEASSGDSADVLYSASKIEIAGQSVKIMRSANIPSLFLNSDEGTMSNIDNSPDHSYGTPGDFSLISSDGELLSAGRLKKIRGRGNATWHGTEKKPYQIEFSSSVSILGLAKSKKYILLANYYDPSLMRNSIAFDIAKISEDYSVSGEPIDLYACGEYLGAYLICEKIDISENKIDIFDLEKATEKENAENLENYERGGSVLGTENGSSKWFSLPNDPADISGGYLLEVEYTERYPEEVSGFVTSRGLPVAIVSPKYASKAQVEYIKNFFCDFEDALYSPTGYNEKGKHYSEYADIDSIIFRYLFEEFALNIDGGISSFHIYKDTDKNGGELIFSCVWDYDCSFGNYNKHADLTSFETLFTGESERRNQGAMPSYFNAMLGHDEIVSRVRDYYKNIFRKGALEALADIDRRFEYIKASAEMDAWLYSSFSAHSFYGANCGSTPSEACNYLKDFISGRIKFFDMHFGYDG